MAEWTIRVQLHEILGITDIGLAWAYARPGLMYVHVACQFVRAQKVSCTIPLVSKQGLLTVPRVTEWRLLGVGQSQDGVPDFISHGRCSRGA